MSFVIITCRFEVGQLGKDFDYGDVGRLDDEVDKSNLALRDVRRLSIVELTYFKAELFLHIALGKELDEEQVAPELAEVPGLGWV